MVGRAVFEENVIGIFGCKVVGVVDTVWVGGVADGVLEKSAVSNDFSETVLSTLVEVNLGKLVTEVVAGLCSVVVTEERKVRFINSEFIL